MDSETVETLGIEETSKGMIKRSVRTSRYETATETSITAAKGSVTMYIGPLRDGSIHIGGGWETYTPDEAEAVAARLVTAAAEARAAAAAPDYSGITAASI
ncbi:hypothetical protein [Methylobacterium nodulans]|uniref:Uncharacterized protein n=1 Tax=Methylobacterium nodulans (strain LMG 21967 / CNCM I-2342 / ORS 2060) TaxID=460265 RepID=B8IIM4_METNO|nr:hypothetical protein [Methylobacterium nodulans]ACL59901.1 hypothetical protein Mnod_5055 [Methylobacterium nodulans ORS 2060]